MHMYDIGNKSGIGFWVCAKNEDSALDIAVKNGHIKNRKNGKIQDITKQALKDDKTNTLKKLLNGTVEGRLIFQGVAYSFQEVLQGTKRKPKGWMILGT